MICATCKNSVRCHQAVYVIVYACPEFVEEPEFEGDPEGPEFVYRPKPEVAVPRMAVCTECGGVIREGEKAHLIQKMSGVCYQHTKCPENPEVYGGDEFC